MSGYFIAFEGIDGCGKSTQAGLLAEKLKSFEKKVILTREPGATPVGKKIREMLFTTEIDPVTEAFLFAADRSNHLKQVILPSLKKDMIVISDRYILSSIVYQGIGKGLGRDFIIRVNEPATNGLLPDLTIILDMPVDIALKRVQNANRFEQMELQKKVRNGFLKEAELSPEKIKVVNADTGINGVTERIWKLLPFGGLHK